MRDRHRAVRVFSSLLLSSLISSSPGQQKSDDQAPTTALAQVTVTATVTDRDHHVVTGLKAQNFTLYVDGLPQPIDSVTFGNVPACIGVLVDRSGSMRPRVRDTAEAVMDLLRAGNPEDLVFLVNFNDEPFLDQDLTRDYRLIERALARAEARGGTALYDTVSASADHLAKSIQCSRRVLVILSDGEDNESHYSLEQTMTSIRNAGNPAIYAIGLPNDQVQQLSRSRRALQTLAATTGGQVFFADSYKDVGKAAQRVAEEIRSQYNVTYVPVPAQSTRNPNIKLVANMPGHKDLDVRVNIATTINLEARLPAPPPPPLTSCIAGTVTDEQKKLVKGITVEAVGPKKPNPSAISDEEGKFKMLNLAAGQYLLYTANESEGYPPTMRPFYREQGARAVVVAVASEKCGNVVIRLGPKAARLRIKVVDATTREPLTHFRVGVYKAASGVTDYFDGDPEHDILLPARTDLTVQLAAPGYGKSQPINIAPQEPGASQQLNITLDRANSSSR